MVAGTVYTNAQPNITSLGSLSGLIVSNATGIVDFTTTSNVTLGNVSNLHISGGTAGYVLKTDGTGNLSWGIDTSAAGGNTREIQFNNSGVLTGNPNLLFDTGPALLTVIGNIDASYATINYQVSTKIVSSSGIASSEDLRLQSGSNVNIQGYHITAGYSNVISVISDYPSYSNAPRVAITGNVGIVGNVTSGNANLGNLVTAAYFSGDGSLLTGLPAGYANSNVAAYLPTYTGNISANYFIGNGSTLTYITGANVDGNVTSAVQSHFANIANSVDGSNVSGQVGNALIAGTVYTNAQPNITSVGTLTSLDVTGNITSGNANLGNLVTSSYFTGDGSLLTGLKPNLFMTVALSDETTAITTGVGKITFRAPFDMTLYQIPRASLSTASSSGNPAIDINKNGTTIFSTTLTIDSGEKTSTTAATAAVLSTTTFADDDEITMDIDTAGTGATGLKVTLYYRRT